MRSLVSGTRDVTEATLTRRRPAARCNEPGVQHQRLAVDPDRDLGDASVDHHLAAIRLVSPKSSATAWLGRPWISR
jgi:hypothetical protein